MERTTSGCALKLSKIVSLREWEACLCSKFGLHILQYVLSNTECTHGVMRPGASKFSSVTIHTSHYRVQLYSETPGSRPLNYQPHLLFFFSDSIWFSVVLIDVFFSG